MQEATSKPAVVIDSCIWIDLANGEVLDRVFQLPHRIIVPEFLTQEEIRPTNWEELSRQGLVFMPASPLDLEEVSRIYNGAKGTIFLPDAAALELARRVSGLLLTDDRRLAIVARDNSVQVEGIIWLLNEMAAQKHIAGYQAAEALEQMHRSGHTIPELELLRWKERWTQE
jgi:predicted nucleic acid-binding protein